jgi:hypothetical protein
MFKPIMILAALSLIPQAVMAKCEGMSLNETTPSKFLVYHTDKEHKYMSATNPISYNQGAGDVSDSEYLYQVSHKKNHEKKCQIVAKEGIASFALKQKTELTITSAEMQGNKFVMNLNDEKIKSIECTGVQTLGDVKDVMDPYLTFECKNKFAWNKTKQDGLARLPASVK